MSKTFLLSLSISIVCLGLLGCNKSSKLPAATEVVDPQKEERISYFTLSNFPSAELWARNASPEIPLISAHRGKPELPGYVENSLEAITKLIQSGSFILELDVGKSKDGVLFLFHDTELDRLTRNTGVAADKTWAELDTMRLYNTEGKLSKSTIPSLEEALLQAKGQAMFTLDRKRGVPLSDISAMVTKLNMHADVALILYNMDDFTEWANQTKLGPISHEAIGVLELEQLAQRCRELYKRFGIPPYHTGDLIPNSGFVGVGLPDKKILAVAKTLGIKTTVGTFGDLDQRAVATKGKTYRDLAQEGVSIIATNKPLLAHKALYGK